MTCGCKKKQLERRRDINHIRNLAKKLASMTKKRVQIYTELVDNQILYNFEPINNTRENIIEYIEWLEQE